MRLAEDNDVVQALAPDRSDQPLGKAILPGRGWCNWLISDAHGAKSACELQNDQLMSKYRILNLKPAVRLEWRGQNGQNEADQRYHCANLADSITSSTRIRFSVYTVIRASPTFRPP